MSRGNQILAGILVLQLVVGVVVFWPRSTPVVSGEPLLAGVTADQVKHVSITDLEEGELRLGQVGEGWVLPGAGDFPCRDGVVEALLDKLVALTADRMVTRTKSSHRRLEVADDDFVRILQLTLSDGTLRTLYVGTSPTYGVSHVRLKGQDGVYLVSGLSSSDIGARASDWVDTAYVSLEQSEVYAVSLENRNGRFVFTKDADANWTLPGLAADEVLQQSAVSSLVSRISSLRMLQPLGKEEFGEYGMASPQATVKLHTRDATGVSLQHTVVIGSQSPEDSSYVAKYSESDYYVRLAEYTVQEWVEKTREELLEASPTPEP